MRMKVGLLIAIGMFMVSLSHASQWVDEIVQIIDDYENFDTNPGVEEMKERLEKQVTAIRLDALENGTKENAYYNAVIDAAAAEHEAARLKLLSLKVQD